MIFLIFTILISFIYGQNLPDIKNLALEELLDYALKNNKTYQSILQNPKIIQGEIVTAGLFPNPQFGTSYTFIGGRPLSDAGSPELAPTLSMELDIFQKRSLRQTFAKKRYDVEKFSTKILERDFKLLFKHTYRELLFIQGQIHYKKEFLATYQDLITASKIRLKNGDISGVEYDRLDLERVAYESEYLSLKLRLQNISQRLRLLLNIPQSPEPLELNGDFHFVPLEKMPVPELSEQDGKNRPDYQELRAKLEENIAYLNLKNREIFPSLQLATEYRHKGTKGYFGVFLTFPLPLFHRHQGEIVSTKEKIKKIEYELEAKESQIAGDISQKKEELHAREKMMLHYEELHLLQRNKDVAKRSRLAYLKKAYSILALLESQRNYISVNWNYFEQLYLYYLSYDNYISALEYTL